jgi:hypothetical protein
MDSTYGANSIFFVFYKAVAPTAHQSLRMILKHYYLPQQGYRF